MRRSAGADAIVRHQLVFAGLYAVPVMIYAVCLAPTAGAPRSNGWVMVMVTLGTMLICHAAALLAAAAGMHIRKRAAERDGFLFSALVLLLAGVPGCFLASWTALAVFGR